MPCNINRASYISLLLLQKGSSCEWISIYSNKHFSLSAKKSLLDFIIFSALLKPFLPGHLSIFFIRVQEGSPFLALPHKRTIILVVLQYTHSTGFNTFHEGTEMECRQYLKWWLGTKPGLWAAAPFSLPPIFPSSARSSRGASLYSAFPQSLAAVASVPFSCFSALLYSSFFSRTRRHFCSALLLTLMIFGILTTTAEMQGNEDKHSRETAFIFLNTRFVLRIFLLQQYFPIRGNSL